MSLIRNAYARFLYDARSTKAPKPSVIYLVVNSKCNLSCSMCDIGSKRKDSQFYKIMNKGCDLELELVKKLVDECGWKPTFAITSTEPLLYKPLFEAIDYIKQNGNKVQLTTNGFLLPDYSLEIVKSKVDDLWVSIDGSEKVHNKIRRNCFSWGNALQGVYDVHAWKKGFKTDLPRVHINYTINKDNFPNLMDFLYSLNLFKAEWAMPDYYLDLIFDVTFSHLNLVTYGMMQKQNETHGNLPATEASAKREDATAVDTDVLWDQIQQVKSRYNGWCSFSPDLKTKEELGVFYKLPEVFLEGHTICRVPWMAGQVLADGTLGISTRCFDVNLGNLHESTFSELWNGNKMRLFRSNLRKVGAYPACARCCGVF